MPPGAGLGAMQETMLPALQAINIYHVWLMTGRRPRKLWHAQSYSWTISCTTGCITRGSRAGNQQAQARPQAGHAGELGPRVPDQLLWEAHHLPAACSRPCSAGSASSACCAALSQPRHLCKLQKPQGQCCLPKQAG